MKRLKLALTVLVVLLALAMLSRFLGWMNLPSDMWFWSGVTGVLALVVAVPFLIATIWRPQQLRRVNRN